MIKLAIIDINTNEEFCPDDLTYTGLEEIKFECEVMLEDIKEQLSKRVDE